MSGIALLLAAYMIPRLILATMTFWRQNPVEKVGAWTVALLLCVGGVLGILAGCAFTG